jgi:hypothetical protein
MNANWGVTANFSYVKPARTSGTPYNYFLTLHDAYIDAAQSDGIIYGRDFSFGENINLTTNTAIKIKGGYDINYQNQTGYSQLKSLTVSNGSVVVERLIIK